MTQRTKVGCDKETVCFRFPIPVPNSTQRFSESTYPALGIYHGRSQVLVSGSGGGGSRYVRLTVIL